MKQILTNAFGMMKIEEICQEAIKELTQEVKLDDNLSLVGIFTDKNNPTPTTLIGYGIYSPSHKDVIITDELIKFNKTLNK